MMNWLDPAAWPEADAFEREQIELSARKRATVAEYMPDLAGLRVLDVGCWCGYQALQMAEEGATALGIDVDPVRLERGRARADHFGLAAEFRIYNLHALGQWPVAARVDLVWCSGVYHHLARPAHGIYQLAWATRDWLVLEGRTDAHPWAQVRRVEPHDGDYATVWASIPTRRWVEWHLEAAGFAVVAVAEHYIGDRSMFVARRKPVTLLGVDADLGALEPGAVVSVPLEHPAMAAVPDVPCHAERWPFGGLPDRSVEAILRDFDPALCVPIMVVDGTVSDGSHRLTALRRMGRKRVAVVIGNEAGRIAAAGAEVL